MRERVIDNATKTAKRHAGAGIQKSPQDAARHYGEHASVYVKTYNRVYRRAIRKINKELAGLETPTIVPASVSVSPMPNSTEVVTSNNVNDDILQMLCASLLSYVGTNETQATEMRFDADTNSEDSFVSYLHEEFPIPQLFASVEHLRFEVQPTQHCGLTQSAMDECLNQDEASEGSAPPVKRSRLL